MRYSLEDRHVEMRGREHFVADTAVVIGSVILEDQASIWFNAVLRGDNDIIHIGAGSNIQDGSVLHADPGFPLTVGRHVTVGHMVMLHGCTIGDHSLIGIHSVILNGANIGANCMIGAYTLITEGKEIPDNSLVIGQPGRVIRTISEDEMKMLRRAAQEYIQKAHRYRTSLAAE
ncbi:MAG: gamma carbonic anhydrase family protein [Gammaproteobacteria bacterium]|nr:gamma carbonic anhydrase family protein [Gammaproteobacteria bacterium]